MQTEDMTGYYTYRGFRDLTGQTDDFNALRFGEGELLLFARPDGTVSGTLSFPAAPGVEEKDFMDLTGRVSDWASARLEFTGRGRPDTGTAAFHYEYDGTFTHRWEAGVSQRPALTGTVLRASPHGSAPAGDTASFVAVKRELAHPRDVPGVALLPEVTAMLASRVHRLRHTTWHTLRSTWRAPLNDDDRNEITQLGWAIARPPFMDDRRLDLNNGAGEDFLYMHRRMIRMVNEINERAGVAPVRGWRSVPGPTAPQFAYVEQDDPDASGGKVYKYSPADSGFMVPPAERRFLDLLAPEDRAATELVKAPVFHTGTMRIQERAFTSPAYLSGLSLGALGSLLEFSIHNPMHGRWSSMHRDAQGNPAPLRDPFDFDEKWDDPGYDYLGEFYSSHVNPVFWRLHGWVDDRIDDWFRAHEAVTPGEVERRELNGISWFGPGKWVVTADPFDWPGSGHDHIGHGHPGDEQAVDDMLEVLRIVERAVNREPRERVLTDTGFRELSTGGLMSFTRWIDPRILSRRT
ncbi:hypothetical protein HS041_23095 [Planomonospora sp. ID67723]|uniref:hypothetical protein n=1 Tax=Planomonospora sp. ID67723 TaxID=2738134 RepID=UPI0018C4175A|nr:hypothetical protein [Planomonospora sp. ID67723]MBG0830653.1 hypothetical protein [Planomonospora sp. ID67723]